MYAMAQSMLEYSGLNGHFWGFAVLTALYLLNRQHKDSTACVPVCRVMHVQRPVSLAHLRIFGCPVWAHVPSARRSKFQPRAVKGVFVGYGPADVYLVFNPATRHVLHSASVQFHETWRQSLPGRLPLPDTADDSAPPAQEECVPPSADRQEEPRPAEPQEEPIARRLRSSTTAVPPTPSLPPRALAAAQPTGMTTTAGSLPAPRPSPVAPTPFPDLSAADDHLRRPTAPSPAQSAGRRHQPEPPHPGHSPP